MLASSLLAGSAALAGCQTGATRRPSVLWPDTAVSTDPLPRPRPHPARPKLTQSAPVTGVLPRSEWTSAGPNLALINPMNGINRITVHHDGMPPVTLHGTGQAADRIELIRRSHVENRGWADIGYHYIIDPDGRIWEGRSTRYQGAHVKYNNEHNLGVLCLGNFDHQQPTPAALATLDSFVAAQMNALRVGLHQVWTHQEIRPTACPGRTLQYYMERTRGMGGRLASA